MVAALKLKRTNGAYLTVAKTGARYDVAVTGGGNLTESELAEIEAYIGDDSDGQAILEKLRAR